MTDLPLDTIAGHLHAGQRFDAAREVLRWSGVNREPKNDAEALEPLNALLYGLLGRGDKPGAAKLLWAPGMFTAEPRCVRMVFNALDTSAMVLLQGGSSMGKTYSAGVYFFLDWLEDPEYTAVKVIGPSEDHLQNNLFSHLMALHTTASIPLPGIRGDLFIGASRRERRGSILGVVVPLGKGKGAGRLQGVKRYPRKKEHPKYGKLSRVRVLFDEFEKIPLGIWSDLSNITSTIEGLVGLKIAGSYNPELVGGMVHQQAEPIGGWNMFDIDKDESWISKRGWSVIRLDPEKSENVIENKVIYPGLQTKEGLDKLAQTSGGTNTAAYATFGRGAYPPQGTTLSIIPHSFLTDFKARFIWLDTPKKCAAVDSALEGGDPACMAIGSFGVATGVEFAPSLQYPGGRTETFKSPAGQAQPRYALCVDQIMNLPTGNTVAVSQEIRRVCEQLKIDPNFLMLDITGNGRGIYDLLREIWAPEVRGVNYSEAATHTKVLQEDTEFCDEIYDRVCSELWFALRRWIEVGAIKLAFGVETEKLYGQFTGREVVMRQGAKRKVESKRDYKHRSGGFSPNEADAVTLLLHGVRMASGVMPGVTPQHSFADENWSEPVAIVGATDRFEDLSTPSQYDFMPGRDLDYMD